MSAPVVIAIVVLVLAAIALVAGAARRTDASSATGQLSRETLRRDRDARRKAEVGGSVTASAPTGRAVERAAVADRAPAVATVSSAPMVWVPPDPETLGVTRRQFLNRSIINMMLLAIGSFAAAAFTAFLWPTGVGGFGSKLRVGKIADLKSQIEAASGFLYMPEGRMWLVEYPETALAKGKVVYGTQPCWPGMEKGVLALYQKCVHLGCRVPACLTSKWFECPCHGSQYNHVGEKKGGPAPRGLDRFAMEVSSDGVLTVNTGAIVQGPPIGTNTTGQEAEGPHCV
ncbi:MAG: Rieske 2Fe-2S domain-containing protein [Microthrixaceae bacterium]